MQDSIRKLQQNFGPVERTLTVGQRIALVDEAFTVLAERLRKDPKYARRPRLEVSLLVLSQIEHMTEAGLTAIINSPEVSS